MIVKKVKYRRPNKPKAWQIGDLVDYIRSPHKTKPHEKVEHAGSRNFLTDTHVGQKGEMIALAQESTRSKMPVAHWIFSWKEDEQPTRSQVDEAVDIFLEHMDLQGHQTIYALHHDTDNYHLHIAVNRMNEITGKVVLPHNGFDIDAAHKVLALIEHRQGWQAEKNARYVVQEDGELVRKRHVKAVKPRQEALEFELATGEKSAQRIAQERGHRILSEATTWEQMHQQLAEINLRFEKKGSGAVVFVASADGEIAVKSSSIDRKLGMGKLTKRLGAFVEGVYPARIKKAQPEAVSTVNLAEWQVYQAECSEIASRLAEQEKAEEDTLAKMKQRHKAERQNAISKLKKHGVPVLNIARHFLALRHKEELRGLGEVRRQRKQQHRKRPRFESWLGGYGLHEQVHRWRHRNALTKKQAPLQTLLEESLFTNSPEAQAFEDYLSARRKTPEVPYNTHAEIVRRQMPDKDISQVDALVALHMRVTGHSPQRIRDALLSHAPTLHRKEGRQKSKKNSHTEGRNWSQYAERTVTYAFGVAADVVADRYVRQAELWQKSKRSTLQNEREKERGPYAGRRIALR